MTARKLSDDGRGRPALLEAPMSKPPFRATPSSGGPLSGLPAGVSFRRLGKLSTGRLGGGREINVTIAPEGKYCDMALTHCLYL